MKSDELKLSFLDRNVPNQDILNLDGPTLKNLEVFESDSGGQTFFDLCNQSQSEGGAKVLLQGLAAP